MTRFRISVYGGPYPTKPYFVGRFERGVLVEQLDGPYERYGEANTVRRYIIRQGIEIHHD